MKHRGFSLLEVLLGVALLGLLTALAVPAWSSVQARLRAVQCAATQRGLGQGIVLYAQENNGELPRSWHSAGANGQPGWAASIAPFLGLGSAEIEQNWQANFNRLYRSPVDPETSPYVYSYAMNVFFELDPEGDDYVGAPQTWRRLVNIPHPSRTIILARTKPVMFGDHLMCHQWSGQNAAKNAMNHDAHNGKANYLFADGHSELLAVDDVLNPAENINRFNPSLAGQKN